MAFDLQSNELEHKFMKERVISVEKHFAEISSKISLYVQKLAYVRDSGDEVAKSISSFASKETYNQSLRLSLGQFSDILSSIQEYRDAQINRTQVKVSNELEHYSPICKQTKVEIKKCYEAREKELKRKAELEKIRSKNPPNWQKIAEKEVAHSQMEASHATRELSKQVEQFEKTKIGDLKRLFLEFVKIEMIYHAKAIELYTKSYNILSEINVEEDLHEFKSHFNGLRTCAMDKVAVTSLQIDAAQTIPKVYKTHEDDISPQSFKGIQGRQRSIYTLKSNTNDVLNSNSSLESITGSAQSQALN